MKRYMFIFKEHSKELLFLAIITVASSLLNILVTYIGGKYIDIVVKANTFNLIYAICSFFLVLSLGNLFLTYLISYIIEPLIEKIVFDIKKYILKHLKKISLLDYNKFNVSYLAKRIDEDSRQIAGFFVNNYITLFIKISEVIIILAVVFKINATVALLMLLLTPVYFVLYKKFKNPIFKKNLLMKEKTAEFFQDYTYQLEYMEDIVIDANFKREENLLNNKYLDYQDRIKEFVTVNCNLSLAQGVILAIMQIVIFLFGGISVIRGTTSIGGLSILMTYFMQILKNISYYIGVSKNYQIMKSSIFRLDEILNIPVQKEGEKRLNDIHSISAKVSCMISKKVIFKDINVEAQKGNIIGIVGNNGTGKTTLMKILVGALKLDSGNKQENNAIIYNDTYRVEDLDSIYLREKCLVYIPQRIRFRDVTIEEIFEEYGIKNSKELFIYMYEKEIEMPDKIKNFFESKWQEKVNNLSGGDKQFITIVLSVVKNGSLYIMDEPTANLDSDRIEWFCKMLFKIKSNKIVFLITHDEKITTIFDKTIFL